VQPFASYPGRGRELLGRPRDWSVCRYGYGLELQRRTGQGICAYCRVSLVDDYYRWLLMGVDHVVPKGQAIQLGISVLLYDDLINLVLCCSGCNGFGNRYRVPSEFIDPVGDWTLDRFLSLRDRVFEDRFQRIAERRTRERAFFESRPWPPP
jgi:hypothetical protein